LPKNNFKRVLIAPLDWGLGHTARCVPIIDWLRLSGHQVVFAGNEWQRAFIDSSIEGIETIHIDGYDVRYGAVKGWEKAALMVQIPRLRQTIKREHTWLQKAVAEVRPDAIISDNRYGLYHHTIPSAIITHQLQVQTGAGDLVTRALQKAHYRYLQQFGTIWVPDVANAPGLAGALSHCKTLPAHTAYIGLLSRFDAPVTITGSDHLLVLLSGPEPQRTMLADALLQQLHHHSGKVVFVAGSYAAAPPSHLPAHIQYHATATGRGLEVLIRNAKIVVCRSGYSTLMDLVRLHKKALLIPTPGQTEQAYLAKSLQERSLFPYALQHGLNLEHELARAAKFSGQFPEFDDTFHLFEPVIGDWLDKTQ